MNNNDNYNIKEAMEFLKFAEGFVDKEYDDPGRVGLKASGYGFTGKLHQEFMNTDRSKEAAEKILERVIRSNLDRYRKVFTNWEKLPDNIKQSILIIGHGRPYFHNYKNTKSVYDKQLTEAINSEDWDKASNALRWGLNQDNIKHGLHRRYNAIAHLMLTGDRLEDVYAHNLNYIDMDGSFNPANPKSLEELNAIVNRISSMDLSKLNYTNNNTQFNETPVPKVDITDVKAPINILSQDNLLYQTQRQPVLGSPNDNTVAINSKFNPYDPIQMYNKLTDLMGGTDLLPMRLFSYGGNLYSQGGGLSFNLPTVKQAVAPLKIDPKLDVSSLKSPNMQFPNSNKVNIGSTILGNLGGLASGVAGIASSALGAAKLKDTSDIENNIQTQAQQTSSALDNSSLIKEWNSYTPMDYVTANSLRSGNTATGVLGGIGAGAGAGSMFGNTGGIVGGVLGGVSGLIGGLFGSSKAKRKARELNRQIDRANYQAQNNYINRVDTLDNMMDDSLERGFYAFGGEVNTQEENLQEFNAGGTHEENPNMGIPISMGDNGQPNLVEEGETKFNNYVYSDRIKARSKKELENVGINSKFVGNTMAEISKKLKRESEERPFDPISRRGLEVSMARLQELQEKYKMQQAMEEQQAMQYLQNVMSENQAMAEAQALEQRQMEEQAMQEQVMQEQMGNQQGLEQLLAMQGGMGNMFAYGGNIEEAEEPYQEVPLVPNLPKLSDNSSDSGYNPFGINIDKELQLRPVMPSSLKSPFRNLNTSHLRYAPALGSAIGVTTDLLGLTNRPNYNIANSLNGIVTPLNYKPKYLNQYLHYRPLDINYQANQLAKQAGATRRNLINTSGGNLAAMQAGLLASDINSQSQLGQLYRQAEEYNQQMRERAMTFNRETDRSNEQLTLQALQNQQANQQALFQVALQKAQLMNQERQLSSQGRSANLTNLFNSLGDIGREAYVRNMITSSPYLLYGIDGSGNINYKGANAIPTPEVSKSKN